MLSILSVTITSFASVRVSGYYRSNGTYVAPYYRSSPNNTTYDNWSTKGNINPYTGNIGTKIYTPSYKTYTPSYTQTYKSLNLAPLYSPVITPSYSKNYYDDWIRKSVDEALKAKNLK